MRSAVSHLAAAMTAGALGLWLGIRHQDVLAALERRHATQVRRALAREAGHGAVTTGCLVSHSGKCVRRDHDHQEAAQQRRGDANGDSGHTETCLRCGKPAQGFARIGRGRYCHTYDPNFQDCYTLALHEGVHRRLTQESATERWRNA